MFVLELQNILVDIDVVHTGTSYTGITIQPQLSEQSATYQQYKIELKGSSKYVSSVHLLRPKNISNLVTLILSVNAGNVR
jgi:hypothetical protein